MEFNSDKNLIKAPNLPLIDYSNADANLKRQVKRDRRKLWGALFYVSLNAVLGYVLYAGFVMRGVL